MVKLILKIGGTIIILLVGSVILLKVMNSPGNHIEGKPYHHLERGFRNLAPPQNSAGFWDYMKFFSRRIWSSLSQDPPESFPVVATDGKYFDSNNYRVTWIGHSTLLVQMEEIRFLTDPIWSERASPVGFAGPKRYTPPAIPFEELPAIDFVLISHNHYDHLDKNTIEQLSARFNPLFFVPLGLKRWFEKLGIKKVVELDWWQESNFKGIRIVCTPAQHFSGRGLWDRNHTLWASWLVQDENRSFYFAGDSGYFPGFKEIGEKYGPIDLVAMPIGAYIPRRIMEYVHVNPDEAIQAFMDLRGQKFVAVHWGTFVLSDEPVDEPPVRVRAAAKTNGLDLKNIWVLKHGETREW